MTTTENKALAYRVYEAINARDGETLNKLFDPQVIRHAMREVGIAKAIRAMEQVSPEKRFVIEDMFAEGDRVALRVTVHGMPIAEGEPLPTILEIFRIANGRVAEIWGAGTLRLPE